MNDHLKNFKYDDGILLVKKIKNCYWICVVFPFSSNRARRRVIDVYKQTVMAHRSAVEQTILHLDGAARSHSVGLRVGN